LSGGEKSRLALAKTLITQSNFLLLDEPTNHLDMFSTSVLAESLDNYAGSLLFVSHDRTFISRVANKIWWIENGEIKEYPGTYDEYQEWYAKRQLEIEKQNDLRQVNIVSHKEGEPNKTSPEKINEAKVSKNQIQRWEQEMNRLEKEIKDLELKNLEIEKTMQSSEVVADSEKLLNLSNEHGENQMQREKLQLLHDEIMEKWIEVTG